MSLRADAIQGMYRVQCGKYFSGQLDRRRSWRLSTDREFAAKAADIVRIYIDPPENALVVSVNEKPQIQALMTVSAQLQLYERAASVLSIGFEDAHGLRPEGLIPYRKCDDASICYRHY